MLCGCLEPLTASPSAQGNNNNSSEEVSPFPGNRRLVKTGGNALVEYDPSKHGSSTHSSAAGADSGKIQVSATVPAGVSGGQTIHVAAPDGRVIAATVPSGMQAGSSFIVEFPPTTTINSSGLSATYAAEQSTLASVALPSDTPLEVPSDSYHGVQILAPPPQQQAASPLPVPVPPPVASVGPPASSSSSSVNKPMLLVKVPPNTAPETTLHVKIPNTDRMIAATVPHGVSEFHVTYDVDAPPSSSATSTTTSLPSATLYPDNHMSLPTPLPVPQHTQTNAPAPFAPVAPAPTEINNQPQRQLILVKVPPGVGPGTMLHVQVPGKDEMIAAQVPPGVTEFHVAYTPSAQGSISQQQQTQNDNTGSRGPAGGDGSDLASLIPMVAGSVLMGAAGVSMFNHHRQMNSSNGSGSGS